MRNKTGRISDTDGYIKVILQVDDFFFPVTQCKNDKQTSGRYVLEHRLVMAHHLGRLLHTWEHVHHKNSIRNDNRLENLELLIDSDHRKLTHQEAVIKLLIIENQNLKDQIAKWVEKHEPENS